MSTALTGAFVEIVVVDNYGTVDETETILSKTTEDIEIDRDPEEIDWVEHGNPNTQRREGAESSTGSFELVLTDDNQNLIDTGMLDDTTNEVLRNVIHDAVRLYIYANNADMEAGTESAVWTYEEAQFVFLTQNIPIDDVATIETEMWVHGRTIAGMGETA